MSGEKGTMKFMCSFSQCCKSKPGLHCCSWPAFLGVQYQKNWELRCKEGKPLDLT